MKAIDALAALNAFAVLEDFLRLQRDAADAVERLGEETLISHAARVAARAHDEHVFELLLSLGRRRKLDGVIAGLGSYQRAEAMPVLLDALLEDEARLSAEAALRQWPDLARPALIRVLVELRAAGGSADESHLRQARSCLALLAEFGPPPPRRKLLRDLMRQEDRQVAILACHLCMATAAPSDVSEALRRLRQLRLSASWSEQLQIDSYLGQ